jgi:hypothetical protein
MITNMDEMRKVYQLWNGVEMVTKEFHEKELQKYKDAWKKDRDQMQVNHIRRERNLLDAIERLLDAD